MNNTTATLTLDGLTVTATIERTEDGPVVTLDSPNANLEGFAPGEYLLTPVHAAASVARA